MSNERIFRRTIWWYFAASLECCQWCRYKLSRESTDAKGQEDCNVWEHCSLHLLRFLSRHGYRSNESRAVPLIKIRHDYLDHWSTWVSHGCVSLLECSRPRCEYTELSLFHWCNPSQFQASISNRLSTF